MAEEMTSEQQEEFKRCANDFSYFAEKYLKINHSLHGIIPLALYDYHKRLYSHVESHRFSILKKFRQGGFTTFMCGYMLWKGMFKLDQSIMFQSKTDREAVNIGWVVRLMLRNLPEWLMPRMGRDNDHHKQFTDTGSTMYFYTPEAACGKAINWLIIDEAAFIPNMDMWWKAMYPVLSTGGNCIVVSTPNGKKNNWFYDVWTGAINGTNNFAPFEASYKEHPDYNDVDWVKDTIFNLGEKGWLQEVEAAFLD